MKLLLSQQRLTNADRQKGAITVEMALTLIFMMGLVAMFWLFSTIFVMHERESYAAFVAARANAVHADAVAAGTTVRGHEIEIGSSSATAKQSVVFPIVLRTIYDRKPTRYTIEQQFTVLEEEEDSGDNAW